MDRLKNRTLHSSHSIALRADDNSKDGEMDPKEYAQDPKHELQVRGIPRMEMDCRFYDNGWLAVKIWDCGDSGFTLESGYPEGQTYKPKEVAEDIFQTFLKNGR